MAKFNWNPYDKIKLERSMDALRAVQQHYFGAYFMMPARCPGARFQFTEGGGRLIERFGKPPELKIYDRFQTSFIGGITTECERVQQLAGLVDHLYHKHRMLSEDIAKCVEDYENAREAGIRQQIAVNRNFSHYTADWR